MPLRSSRLELIKRHVPSPLLAPQNALAPRQRAATSSVSRPEQRNAPPLRPGRDCLHNASDPATDLTELTRLFVDGDVRQFQLDGDVRQLQAGATAARQGWR